MRKPNPDPHPERVDIMRDDSPEGILWRQTERFLESLWASDERGMHGAMSGLQIVIAPYTIEDNVEWASKMKAVMDINDAEERSIEQAKLIVCLIDSKGKWLKAPQRDVQEGTEWRESFQ